MPLLAALCAATLLQAAAPAPPAECRGALTPGAVVRCAVAASPAIRVAGTATTALRARTSPAPAGPS